MSCCKVSVRPRPIGTVCGPPCLTTFEPWCCRCAWDRISLERAAAQLRDAMDAAGSARATMCGLSLGAMVALRFGLDHSDRTDRLVLSGVQIKPPRLAMGLQNLVMRALPSRLVAVPGATKNDVLAVTSAIASVDLTPELSTLDVPTTVLCGQRDGPNLPAARAAAAAIPGAQLRIVPRVGHEWNRTNPQLFADYLMAALRD